jgi:predicted MPP superfamily phosphohydrolase
MTPFLLVFIAISIGIIGFLHLVVYKALMGIFLITTLSHIITLRVIFVFLTFSFIGAIIFSSHYNTIFSRALYLFSSYWMGLLFFLFLASIIYGLTIAFSPIWFGKLLILCAVGISIYGVYHANDIQITRYEVMLSNLPEVWKGKKAVLVSDLHLGQVRGKSFSAKVAGVINNEQPDIVFVAGDLYDGVKVEEKEIIAPLSTIKASWGIYYAPGNHEEMRGPTDAYFAALEAIGINVLRDEKQNVEGVDIIGADYQTTEDAAAFKTVLEKVGVEKERPSILIKHVPLHLEVPEQAGISLALSGHTHHAQIWPLSYLTRKIYKGYDYGVKAYGEMMQITTSGVGTWGPAYRVGTKSEIVVITFL